MAFALLTFNRIGQIGTDWDNQLVFMGNHFHTIVFFLVSIILTHKNIRKIIESTVLCLQPNQVRYRDFDRLFSKNLPVCVHRMYQNIAVNAAKASFIFLINCENNQQQVQLQYSEYECRRIKHTYSQWIFFFSPSFHSCSYNTIKRVQFTVKKKNSNAIKVGKETPLCDYDIMNETAKVECTQW